VYSYLLNISDIEDGAAELPGAAIHSRRRDTGGGRMFDQFLKRCRRDGARAWGGSGSPISLAVALLLALLTFRAPGGRRDGRAASRARHESNGA